MKVVVRLLPAFIWMSSIFYLSSRTGDDMGGWLSQIQRLIPYMEGFDWGHFVAYFILSLTYIWAFRSAKPKWRHKMMAVILCVIYGVTDEYHQSFVPGRTPDLMDIRNDAIGAVLAMLFITIPFIRNIFESFKAAKYY